LLFPVPIVKREPKFYNKRNSSPPVPNLGFLKIERTVTTVAALGVCPIPFPAARFAQSGAGLTISVRLENHPSRCCIWSWWQQHTRRSCGLTCEPCRRGLRFLKRLMLHLTIQVGYIRSRVCFPVFPLISEKFTANQSRNELSLTAV